MLNRIVIFLILFMLAQPISVLADQSSVNLGVEIKLFLKVITYDLNFSPSSADRIHMLVVYDRSIPDSYSQKREIERFMRQSGDLEINGVKLEYDAVSVAEFADVAARLSKSDYNVMIVTAVNSEMIGTIAEIAQEAHTRTFAVVPEYVYRGLSVGVRTGNNRQSIVINLNSSRMEGSNFSAHLLRICEVIKN